MGSSDTPLDMYVDSPIRIETSSSGGHEGNVTSTERPSGEMRLVIAEPLLGVPRDIEPLRFLPASGESSGTPSTSEPTNILNNNPQSRVSEQMLRVMKIVYRIPKSIEVRVPNSGDRVDFKILGWTGFYERPLEDGFRFPIPKLAWELLNHFEIAPSQLMPNTWRILLSIEVMAYKLGLYFGIRDLLYSYYLKEHVKEKGRYLLFLRQKREQLVLGLTTNDRGDWQKFYFFVRGEKVFGDSGRGRIPEHWSTSSE